MTKVKAHPKALPLLLPIVLSACTATTAMTEANPPCPAPSGTAAYQCFDHPEDAASGMARLYVFRPSFSGHQSTDTPVLVIDGSDELTLPRWSYARFDLALGKHHFKLAAGPRDSDMWNLEGQFDVQAVGRYYLAIWDARMVEAGDSSPSETALGTAMTVPLIIPTLHGLLIIRSDGSRGETRYTKSARYELVNEQEAIGSIRECVLVPTKKVNPQIRSVQ